MTLLRARLAAAMAFTLLPSFALAQHVQILHQFEAPIGSPSGRLVEAVDGAQYGPMTGGIYRRAANGDVTVPYRFGAGDVSVGALTLGSDDGLYGTTTSVDLARDVVFRFDPRTATARTLHELAPPSEGARPRGPLARVGQALFGVTAAAPNGQVGWTVFRVGVPDGRFETVFVSLAYQANALQPVGGVIATGGRLYGLANLAGVLTSSEPSGDRVYRFDPDSRAIDAVFPLPSGVTAIFATSDGQLYGRGFDRIFRIDPTSGAVEIVATLPLIGIGFAQTCLDLVEGFDGHLYGVSVVEPFRGTGGLFRIRRAGATHTYEPLRPVTAGPIPTDLSPSGDGFIYGFLPGIPWKLFRFDALERGPAPDPLQYSVVFTPPSQQPYAAPSAPVEASDGFLYGTTYAGGPGNRGAAYRLDPTSGTVTMLGDIPGPEPQGFQLPPILGQLVEAPNGMLYGTSVVQAAPLRPNRVIRLDPDTGVVTVAATIPGNDVESVATSTALTRTASGVLYGVTRYWHHADVFRFDPNTNAVMSVASMSTPLVVAQTTGLTVGGDGRLYGAYVLRTTTSPFLYETHLYRVDENAGTLEDLGDLSHGGAVSNVVAGANGVLYVVAGNRALGFTPATGVLHQVGCAFIGGGLVYGLARGPDVAIYGFMGPPATSTLFQCGTPIGGATSLEQLNGAEGAPQTALMLASDGFFYGATLPAGNPFEGTGSLAGGGAIIRVAVAGRTLPDIDSDGDGLPNTWETSFGLNPSSATADGGPTGDPDGDGQTNAQELAAGTHPRGFAVRYFAEGATGSFFRTRLTLFNPRSFTANVLLRFLTDAGTTVSHHFVLPAGQREGIDVASLPGLASANFSTVVESDQPLAVDRTMNWDATGYGSHSETAVAAPSTTWYLAEGSTSGDFALFYLLQNPQPTAVTATVTYLLPFGATPIVRTYTLAPQSRTTIQVDAQPGLESTDVSASITATAPIIAERAMYLSKPGQPFAAGHESAGVTAAALEWFLAEGATGPFFDTFVLIANPNPQRAQVTVEYLLSGGGLLTKNYTVAANSRFTIWVDDEELPAGSGQKPLANVAVSTTVRSTNNVPIVVERTMWWPGPEVSANFWYEAHNSPGTITTASRWAFADGALGGTDAAETYVLIANPAATAAQARVTAVLPGGTTRTHDYTLAPKSRTSVPISVTFPDVPRVFSVIVESVGGPAPLVVERATYASPGGVTWASGTNALAVPVP